MLGIGLIRKSAQGIRELRQDRERARALAAASPVKFEGLPAMRLGEYRFKGTRTFISSFQGSGPVSPSDRHPTHEAPVRGDVFAETIVLGRSEEGLVVTVGEQTVPLRYYPEARFFNETRGAHLRGTFEAARGYDEGEVRLFVGEDHQLKAMSLQLKSSFVNHEGHPAEEHDTFNGARKIRAR